MNKPDWLLDGPADASRHLILAHGAGQGMRSGFMKAMAQGLGAAGLRVVRFRFPYMIEMERTGKGRPPDRRAVLLDASAAPWASAASWAGFPRHRLIHRP
jgi:hypothetical protein